MPRHIPVDLILHALVESLLELPEDHLRDLARAISARCIDPRLVADQWCDGHGVTQSATWLVRRLDGGIDRPAAAIVTTGKNGTLVPTGEQVTAETRAMEVAIARRLADVGLALLVTQDAEDRAAASLLLDASRLVVGLERAQAANHDEDATRTIDALRYEVKAKAANIDDLMEANARHRRDIAEKDTAIITINPPLGWCGKVENVGSGDAKLPIYVRGTPFDGGCTEQWLPAEALDIITPTA